MKIFALALMLALAVLAFAQPSLAWRQGVSSVRSVRLCSDVNASVTSTTQVVVIANCNVGAGVNGVVIASAQAETNCGTTATEAVQMLIGPSVPVDGAAPPAGMTAMTPLLHQNGCNGVTLITKLAGSFVGTPGSTYYVTVTLSTSNGAQAATWNNQTIKVLTY